MTDNRTTELLREGLTEHGIEWRSGLKGVTFVGDWCFVEYDSGKLAATCEPVLTPEQAIAATLGSGTCQLVEHEALASMPSFKCWSCSECGYGWHHSIYDKQFSYCPNCGRKVVGE